MKIRALLIAGLMASGAAQAGTMTLGAGSDFINFSRTPDGGGIGFTFDYLKHDHNGSAGGLGAEFALPLGNVTLAAGVKGTALDADGSASAGLVGGRINVDAGHSVSLFGQAYYAPESFASGSVKSVSDVTAGVRWNPIPLLAVEGGYRYYQVDRKDESRSRTLADGPYLGVGLVF